MYVMGVEGFCSCVSLFGLWGVKTDIATFRHDDTKVQLPYHSVVYM